MEELAARRDLYQGFGNALGQAFELVGAPMLFGVGGLLLDRWLGWSPVLTIIFGLWGLVGGVLRIYYGYVGRMKRARAESPWAPKSGEA